MRQYLGIEYKDFGRDKEGLDCWGLCVLIAKDIHKYDLPLLNNGYESATDGGSVHDLVEIEKLKEWVKVTEYEAGDIAVFRVAGFSCHVATCVNKKEFIHILAGSDVTIEKFDSLSWSNRLEGVYRRCKK